MNPAFIAFSQSKIKDARMIRKAIFIDLGRFLSFIQQTLTVFGRDR
jgi:hypothetical protein